MGVCGAGSYNYTRLGLGVSAIAAGPAHHFLGMQNSRGPRYTDELLIGLLADCVWFSLSHGQ
jgi:hypothetical protein